VVDCVEPGCGDKLDCHGEQWIHDDQRWQQLAGDLQRYVHRIDKLDIVVHVHQSGRDNQRNGDSKFGQYQHVEWEQLAGDLQRYVHRHDQFDFVVDDDKSESEHVRYDNGEYGEYQYIQREYLAGKL
jgi:hypothetical protein